LTFEEVGVVRKRLLKVASVAVLGCALASAPMAVASASYAKSTTHHPKKKPKPKPKHKAKHHATTTTATAALNPGSKLCAEAYAGETNSGNVGSAVETAMESALASGNFDAAKQAIIAALNTSLKEEAPAEAALRSAPANVQAAMKGLFAFVSSYETAINSASSFAQLGTSIESIAQTSGVQADATTLANYLTQQCGPPPTTTTTSLSIP
jgi:hypothetical protein